jgi:hypothetical protein
MPQATLSPGFILLSLWDHEDMGSDWDYVIIAKDRERATYMAQFIFELQNEWVLPWIASKRITWLGLFMNRYDCKQYGTIVLTQGDFDRFEKRLRWAAPQATFLILKDHA